VHQWAKNLLLAVPALLAQVAGQPRVALTLLVAFLAFSITASGNYLLNDLVDVESDRRHPHKRHRPLASGRVPVAWVTVCAPVLMIGGIGAAWVLVNQPFALMLIAYVLLAMAYSKLLKRVLLVDVMVLAALYTLRLLAGGAAVDVPVSSWLLVFSLFFFVSLAFAKRLTEIDHLAGAGTTRNDTRAYVAGDRDAFAVMGPAAGMLSILVLTLYVSSEAIRAHYRQPDVLWMLCPLLLYWIMRIWFLTLRRELHHDPVVFALRDGVSYAVAAGILLVLGLAAGYGA
jgi:4-hydroxybenzoate polyprenyltransferase